MPIINTRTTLQQDMRDKVTYIRVREVPEEVIAEIKELKSRICRLTVIVIILSQILISLLLY